MQPYLAVDVLLLEISFEQRLLRSAATMLNRGSERRQQFLRASAR
jgi:hypothetical protein